MISSAPLRLLKKCWINTIILNWQSAYFLLIVCILLSAIYLANSSYPLVRIISRQAFLSDPKMIPNILDMKLLNFLHSIALGYSLQSAHEEYPCSRLHKRILHHEAFSFPAHPGHVPLRNDLHDPQYKPQKAICFVSAIISFIC